MITGTEELKLLIDAEEELRKRGALSNPMGISYLNGLKSAYKKIEKDCAPELLAVLIDITEVGANQETMEKALKLIDKVKKLNGE